MGKVLSLFDWRPRTDSAAGTSLSENHSRPAGSAESRASLRDPDGLRVYQRDAVENIKNCLSVNRATLAVMATGLGKTQIFGAVARHWKGEKGEPGRVLVIAHRTELIGQAQRRIELMTNEAVGVEQADEWAGRERIVVASVQTLGTSNDYRLRRLGHVPFKLIIVDEAHHAVAKTYRRILDAFPEAKVLGVTATPDRGDEVALGEIFQSVAYRRDYLEGRNDGYLVPVKALTIELGEVDLSRVKTTAGDLNIGQLDTQMQKGLERIAHGSIEYAGARMTIVFVTGVETAYMLAETFNKVAGRQVAVAVDGKTPWDERRKILEAHKRGDFQFLINVGIATEGYDSPGVSCVVIARPTKSRALYAQMAGRGGRVLPGLVEDEPDADLRRSIIESSGKPDLLLLDFVGQAGKHKLCSPVDILGGRDIDEKTASLARRLLHRKLMSPDEAVIRAKEKIAQRERRLATINAVKATVRTEAYEVDAYGRPDFDEYNQPFWARHVVQERPDPITEPQWRCLKWAFKVPERDIPATKKAAGRLIGQLKGAAKWSDT